jgi:hypothetical protein
MVMIGQQLCNYQRRCIYMLYISIEKDEYVVVSPPPPFSMYPLLERPLAARRRQPLVVVDAFGLEKKKRTEKLSVSDRTIQIEGKQKEVLTHATCHGRVSVSVRLRCGNFPVREGGGFILYELLHHADTDSEREIRGSRRACGFLILASARLSSCSVCSLEYSNLKLRKRQGSGDQKEAQKRERGEINNSLPRAPRF